jgi:hypothetical protein
MGLDIRPMGKPKQGFEERFEQIFRLLNGKEKVELSFFDKLKGKTIPTHDELLKEWIEIQEPSYITIKAPRVGTDKVADDWIKSKYKETDKKLTEEQFINEFQDYYVIELAEHLDGVPVYISMGQDENVFRGQFLADCEDLIGHELVNEAWESKFAKDTIVYGNKLMKIADTIAMKHNLQYLKDQRMPPDVGEETIESKLHIIYSLSKWLIFYGSNGHGYEADY